MTETVSAETPESRWPALFRGLVRGGVTVAFIAAAGGAGVLGYGALSARTAEVSGPDPAPATSVAPIAIELTDSLTLARVFTGQFEASQETVLGFEEAGTLAAVHVREGDRVAAGEVIATLDTRLLQAERQRLLASRDALAAQVELARLTNDRQQALWQAGHVPAQRADEAALQLAQHEAQLAEMAAAVAGVEVRLGNAEIRAPFAGRVGARVSDTGTVLSPGAAVVTLLETGAARFRVGLDPTLAASLDPETEVTIRSGLQVFTARLSELSPALDAATRSQIAVFDLTSDAMPPSGAAGEMTLDQHIQSTGAWVPISALRQGPRGTWLLLTVEGTEQPVVGSEAAEILHLDAGRAFVRGSFTDGTLVLPAGTHRVVPGETVRLAGAGS